MLRPGAVIFIGIVLLWLMVSACGSSGPIVGIVTAKVIQPERTWDETVSTPHRILIGPNNWMTTYTYSTVTYHDNEDYVLTVRYCADKCKDANLYVSVKDYDSLSVGDTFDERVITPVGEGIVRTR